MKIAVSGERLGRALPSTLNISINYFRPVSVNLRSLLEIMLWYKILIFKLCFSDISIETDVRNYSRIDIQLLLEILMVFCSSIGRWGHKNNYNSISIEISKFFLVL